MGQNHVWDKCPFDKFGMYGKLIIIKSKKGGKMTKPKTTKPKTNQEEKGPKLKGVHLRLPGEILKEIRKSAIDEDMTMQEFIVKVYNYWKNS